MQSTDAELRNTAQSQLLALQQSPQIWSCVTGWLEEGKIEDLGFFAIQTLLVKIHSGRWLEELSSTSQQEALLEWILSGLCRLRDCSKADEGIILREGLIIRKMSQVIAALVTHAYPSLWQDPIGDLLAWLQIHSGNGCVGRVHLILDAIMLVPVELERMVPVIDDGSILVTSHRPKADPALYRLEHYLRGSADLVYGGLAGLTSFLSNEIVERWYGTLHRWIAAFGETKPMEGASSSSLTACLDFVAQAAYSNTNVDRAVEIFEEVAKTRAIDKSSTVISLINIAARLTECHVSLRQLYLTLAEYHEDAIINECFLKGNCMAFIQAALDLSLLEQKGPIYAFDEDENEEVTQWLDFLSFWTFLQDGLADDIASSLTCQTTFRDLTGRLLMVLSKLPPNINISCGLSIASRIRTEVGLTICACMQVIGQASTLDLFLAHLAASTNSYDLMAGLLALESISEDICIAPPAEATHDSIMRLLHGLPQYGRDADTQRACLALLGAYAPVMARQKEMLESAVQMLLGAACDKSLVLVACDALEKMLIAWQANEESSEKSIISIDGLNLLCNLAQQNMHNQPILKSLFSLIGSVLASPEYCKKSEVPLIFGQLFTLSNGDFDSALTLIKASRFPEDVHFPVDLLTQIVPALLEWCQKKKIHEKDSFNCSAALEEIIRTFGNSLWHAGISPDLFIAACPAGLERINIAGSLASTIDDPFVLEGTVATMNIITLNDHEDEFEAILNAVCKIIESIKTLRADQSTPKQFSASFLETLYISIIGRLKQGNIGTPLLKAITRMTLLTINQRDRAANHRRIDAASLIDRFFGLPMMEATLLAQVRASPSQLETMAKLMFTLMTSDDPNLRNPQLANLLSQPAFPCPAAGVVSKEHFLKQAVAARTLIKFRQALFDLFNAMR